MISQPPDGTNASSSVTPPQTVDPCEWETRTSNKTTLWRDCYIKPWRYPIPGFNKSFIDWSRGNGTHQNPGQLGIAAGLWWADSYPQHHIWKIAGALDAVELSAKSPSSNVTIRQKNVTACVKPPHVLLIDNVTIHVIDNSQFNVSCINCKLSTCVTWLPKEQRVIVLHQPSFGCYLLTCLKNGILTKDIKCWLN